RMLLAALLMLPLVALAQFVVLTHEQARVTPAQQLVLDADLRFELPAKFDRVLQAAVPLVFIAEAQVYARRWYWRDERIASSQRTWKLLYQPLTNTWRVTTGNASESYADLNSALIAVSRLENWVLAGKTQLDKADGRRLYVDLSYRLDTTQLPPLLLLGSGSGTRWDVGVQQQLDVDP
ncbi:DUF4390 domain-containing protein, partial [Amphibiibacter pelophylacis]